MFFQLPRHQIRAVRRHFDRKQEGCQHFRIVLGTVEQLKLNVLKFTSSRMKKIGIDFYLLLCEKSFLQVAPKFQSSELF